MESIRGVYLASQLEEDQSVHTMITFDRGGTWQNVRRPEGAPCHDEMKVSIGGGGGSCWQSSSSVICNLMNKN